ncbi:winged helix-turn-helix transcriptional regulator, partial [Acinetobacter baumannii]
MRELVQDARISQVILSERVGLSPTACARRLHLLEKAGIIRGYSADIDAAGLGFLMTVLVHITLDRQNEDALTAFEREIE